MPRVFLALALTLCFSLCFSQAHAADHPVRIAFVDTGNTGRSITAEALAQAIIDADHLNAQVISRAADLNPFNTHPEANFVALLRQRGIDITAHTAAQFGPQDAKYADIILTMTEAHKAAIDARYPDVKGKIFTLAAYATGENTEIADAFGKPLEIYQATLAQLDPLVRAALLKATKKP